ncbi:MAG: hypothetical protein AAB678_01155 [Patescibacteria group bacterium]
MKFHITWIASFSAALVLLGAGCITLGGTAAGPMGMFRSLDKGETWQATTAYPTTQGVKSIAGVKVYRVYTDPSDPNALYLGSRGQGLYFSYNNGDSWQSAPALNGMFIYGLAVDPKDKCNIYVSDGLHIYKTSDCTRTWKLVYTEERPAQRFVSLAVNFGDSKIIYGAQLGGDILVSRDSGASWRVAKRFGFDLQQLNADPFNASRLYAASYKNGLFRSDDNGEGWLDVSGELDNFSNAKTFYRLIMHPSQKDSLFWVSKYGILRSNDAGATWNDLKLITPPGSVNIFAFAISPKDSREMYYTGTILNEKNVPVRSTFYKTADGGTNWVTKKLPSTAIPTALWVHPDKTNTLFIGFTLLD